MPDPDPFSIDDLVGADAVPAEVAVDAENEAEPEDEPDVLDELAAEAPADKSGDAAAAAEEIDAGPDVLDELAAAAPVAAVEAAPDTEVDSTLDVPSGPDVLDELAAAAPQERAEPAPAAPIAADDDDLVAIADAAASRFADDVAAQAAADAAVAARHRRPEPAITDVPRRRLRSEDDDPERGVLQYPSALFPSPPVFRVRIPDGWIAMPLPEAEMAVRRPDPIDGVVANVIVRVRRTAATAATDEDLRAALAIDVEPDGMEVVSDDLAADVATPVRRLMIRFPGPDGAAPLLARHLLVYVPATEHVASVVWLAATWPESAGPAVAAEMEAIVASLRLFRPH